jgi:hypothetical protein
VAVAVVTVLAVLQSCRSDSGDNVTVGQVTVVTV